MNYIIFPEPQQESEQHPELEPQPVSDSDPHQHHAVPGKQSFCLLTTSFLHLYVHRRTQWPFLQSQSSSLSHISKTIESLFFEKRLSMQNKIWYTCRK
jgi:hypothetical protein